MDLAGFIDTFKDSIAQRVVESYPPLYRPSEQAVPLPALLRNPLGARADAIRGAVSNAKNYRPVTGATEGITKVIRPPGTESESMAALQSEEWR